MSHADERAFTRVTHPRARAADWCDACHETIAAGQRYARIFAASDGTGETIRQCLRCEAIWQAIADASPPGSVIMLTLDCGESWVDAFGCQAPEHVEALAFALHGEVGL